MIHFDTFRKKKDTIMRDFDTFSSRTDTLATSLGCGIDDLPDVLGVSRASLYGYRKGRRNISNKAWAKLEQAEQAAGIGSDERDPPEVQESDADKLIRLMDEMNLDDAARAVMAGAVMKSTVDAWWNTVHEFWLNSGALATLSKKAAAHLDGELKDEIELFSGLVLVQESMAIESLDSLRGVLLEMLGDDSEKGKSSKDRGDKAG